MKNLENYGVLEMNANEIKEVQGGKKVPDNYNEFLAAVLFPFYTLGYILGNL